MPLLLFKTLILMYIPEAGGGEHHGTDTVIAENEAAAEILLEA